MHAARRSTVEIVSAFGRRVARLSIRTGIAARQLHVSDPQRSNSGIMTRRLKLAQKLEASAKPERLQTVSGLEASNITIRSWFTGARVVSKL
jgi:hypothetical protein